MVILGSLQGYTLVVQWYSNSTLLKITRKSNLICEAQFCVPINAFICGHRFDCKPEMLEHDTYFDRFQGGDRIVRVNVFDSLQQDYNGFIQN